MPENADRAVRFEVIAHVAGSISQDTKQSCIKLNRLKQVFNSGVLASPEVVKDEDPHEFAFTESFAFFDGSYTVFPGVADDTTFILRHLLGAIFRQRHLLTSEAFLEQAFNLTRGILLLSDEIARRAKLGRGLDPSYAPERPVAFPSLGRLSELKNAVNFSRAEMEILLGSGGLSLSVLNDLTIPLGTINFQAYRLNKGELFARPIIQAGDQYIVTLPGRLLTALSHALINLAVRANVKDEVVTRYTQSVWRTVLENLYYLNIQQEARMMWEHPQPPDLADGVFGLDTDKVLYVILATDSLTEYDADDAFGQWQTGELSRRLESRIQKAISYLFSLPQPPNEVMVLELMQGVGRGYALPIRRPQGASFLLMGAADLQTIAQLEGGKDLILYKYAQAARRIRQTTRIGKASELDEFYLFRKNGYSYYVSDEERYTHISVLPGYAGDLRQELRQLRDWHPVRSYRRGRVVDLTEITLLYSDSRIPIYISKDSLDGAVEILVKGSPLPIWITVSPFESDAQRSLRNVYAQFAEAIGYWLWQFMTSLTPALSVIKSECPHILIEIRIERAEEWENAPDASDTSDSAEEPAIVVKGLPGQAKLNVTLTPAINPLIERADNSGEREMMRHVLSGLHDLLPTEQRATLTDETINSIIDRHAPLGVKKKLLFFDARAVPDIDPRGLPKYRSIQKADENELLDELGDFLAESEGLRIGPIHKEERTLVLRKTVGFFYEKLKGLVATLNPNGLLEWLIEHQEAATRESAFHRMTIPTRLACFSSEAEMVEKLQEETPRLNAALVASRFVIEYVAAQPPKGVRLVSASVYDHLQALAWHVIHFGFQSDLIHFGLSDPLVEILPSGRLGADMRTYRAARSAYLPAVMQGDIRRSTQFFGVHWRKSPATEQSPDNELIQLDEAAIAEFGFSLTEQLDFIVAAMDVGETTNPGAPCLPRDEFVERQMQELGWEAEKVSRALDLLSLCPRKDFLNPDPPYRGEDVYPWRYNRALSYLRCPFVIRHVDDEGCDTEVLWGTRHLTNFWKNIAALCRQGRLKARSPQMTRLMGEFNRRRGSEFNDTVAELFAQKPDLIVRSRVKRVGALRLQGPQGDLGDIDVLVADPKRRHLMPIECKDLALARTPYEMSSEITNLFRGTPVKKSIVDLHQRRVQWIREHLPDVLAWIGINDSRRWKLRPLIVVDQELFTPYLQSSPIPIMSIETLKRTGPSG